MSEVNILPQNNIIKSDTELNSYNIVEPTRTFKVDLDKGKIVGFCDDIEALKQAIYFVLTTERYEYIIYPWTYGTELKHIKTLDKKVMESEFERCITEALVEDDRIVEVNNFKFEYGSNKDSVLVKFTVLSIYGSFSVESEVV